VRVGIEKLRVYPPSLALGMDALCAARDHDPADARDNLMIDRRGVNPTWEDPVTMAVNAAAAMLTDEDRASIELLIVGSETSVDQEKPLSSWVHGFLGLPSGCRNFEVKHACYSGTAGLQMAAAWLAAGLSERGKALVINTDQSLIGFGEPYEFVFGGGAAAVLLSRRPEVLELELGKSGVFAHDVTDVIRPTPRVETGSSETSLYSYLEALDGAFDAYQEKVGQVDLEKHFQRIVYHAPFGGMTFRAHRRLLTRDGDRPAGAVRASWERMSAPALRYGRQMGGSYGSSTFVGLLGLLEGDEALRAGDRVGIYAYGSGACAEFYSGKVGPNARAVCRAAGLQALLDARRPITVAEYEAVERARDAATGTRDFRPDVEALGGWYDRHYRGRGLLVLEAVDGWVRRYKWS
jgi:hydroxymethylglutaryl-CoA synthase